MARVPEPRWEAAHKRWRVRYKGKSYRFDGGKGKSDREAYRAAKQAWAKLKLQLDSTWETDRPGATAYLAAIEEWEAVLSVLRTDLENHKAKPNKGPQPKAGPSALEMKEAAVQRVEDTLARLREGWNQHDLPDPGQSLLDDLAARGTKKSQADWMVWRDRITRERETQERKRQEEGTPRTLSRDRWRSSSKSGLSWKGDYVFALKDNHPKLAAAVRHHFEEVHSEGLTESGVRSKTDRKKQASREEERFYAVGPIPKSMKALTDQWPGAKSIGQAITTTERAGITQEEVRYYISSRPALVGEFANCVRNHWRIESMHWILDVVFHEDASRVRTKNAASNLSFSRRFATTLLKRDTYKRSIRGKRKKAARNSEFLQNVLFAA